MNAAAAGKLALCICTGAVVGAGVNEARHDAKPAITKTAAKAPHGAGRKVVQFPCEPYIVQDQMMRDASIPTDFDASDLPQFAALALPGPGLKKVTDGGGDGGGGSTPVPEPAVLGLLGLGAAGLLFGRKTLLARTRG